MCAGVDAHPRPSRLLDRPGRGPRFPPQPRGAPLNTSPPPFPGTLLGATIAAVVRRNSGAEQAARERLDQMTKPPGSLGVLEDVAAQLAGIAGSCPAPLPTPAALAVFAGDHGVHAQGVTPWPQEVTAQMVATFVSGGAVVNAFAAEVGATVLVVDVGVASLLHGADGLLDRKVRAGTADLAVGPA